MTQLAVRDKRRLDYGGLAGVAGVVVPALGLVMVPIWEFPATTATAAQIGSFAVQRHGALQVMMIFYTLGVTLWLIFRKRSRRIWRLESQHVLPRDAQVAPVRIRRID